MWLRNPSDFNPEEKEQFDLLRQIELKTARAWHLKETLANFWFLRSRAKAKRLFDRWYNWGGTQPLKAYGAT